MKYNEYKIKNTNYRKHNSHVLTFIVVSKKNSTDSYTYITKLYCRVWYNNKLRRRADVYYIYYYDIRPILHENSLVP